MTTRDDFDPFDDEDSPALDPPLDAALHERLWREEIERRLARLRSGETQLIPWEETERRLLSR